MLYHSDLNVENFEEHCDNGKAKVNGIELGTSMEVATVVGRLVCCSDS